MWVDLWVEYHSLYKLLILKIICRNPLRLPPHAPELNPTENIWQYLRQNYLAPRVLDDYDAIVEACRKAWNDLLATPDQLASITRRNWANVS